MAQSSKQGRKLFWNLAGKERGTLFFKLKKALIYVICWSMILTPLSAAASPQDGAVEEGSANLVQENPGKFRIDQHTQKAIIDWRSFSIGQGEYVDFIQPHASALAVNRVIGNHKSEIFGKLTANGQVMLINQHGILFGQSVNVDVHSLVATTIDIPNAFILNNDFTFNLLNNSDASVVNRGEITAADGGVVNITARTASGLMDSVINMDGLVQAQTIQEKDGEIVLFGGNQGAISVAGTLDASGRDPGKKGGMVKVLGQAVGMVDNAKVDVSGYLGGGDALIGGNYQGQGPEMNADFAYIAVDAELWADALSQGGGGRIIIWADDTTQYDGCLSAPGGALCGNGGFAEVSGKNILNFDGEADLSAGNGHWATFSWTPRTYRSPPT